MTLYFNAGEQRRVWTSLTNAKTGRTLELGPGEEAEIDVPADFSDPFLTIRKSPSASSSTTKTPPEPPTTGTADAAPTKE